jgi:hypothetical protein
MSKDATEGKGWKLTLAGRNKDGSKKDVPNIVHVWGTPAGRAHWKRDDEFALPARMNLFDGFIDVLLRHGGDFLIVQPVNAVGKFHQERFFRIPRDTDRAADMRNYSVQIY